MGWELKGNIMGPPGEASLPDPLPVDTELDLGAGFRLVAIPGGGRIQAKGVAGTWVTQAEWAEAT